MTQQQGDTMSTQAITAIPLEAQRCWCPFCGIGHLDGYGRPITPHLPRKERRPL